MAKSPAKDTNPHTGMAPPHTTEQHAKKSKKKGTDYTAMQAKSAKADPRYGKMSAEDYKTEVQRQVTSKKETGSYDAMGTGTKTKTKTASPPPSKVTPSKVKTKTLTKKETKAKTVPKTLVGNIGRGISNWAASQAGTAKDRASFVPKPTRKSVKKQVVSEIEKMGGGMSKKEAKKLYKTSKKSVKKEQKVEKLKKQKKDAEGGKTKFWQFRSNKEKAANRAKRISKLEKK